MDRLIGVFFGDEQWKDRDKDLWKYKITGKIDIALICFINFDRIFIPINCFDNIRNKVIICRGPCTKGISKKNKI